MLLTARISPTRASAGWNQASACKTAAMMLRWVSTAPLERPVVPPVYCRNAMSSAWARLGLSVWLVPSASAWRKLEMVRGPSMPITGSL
ncbi:hypothetical protein D9M68_697760 [compost metagenome]